MEPWPACRRIASLLVGFGLVLIAAPVARAQLANCLRPPAVYCPPPVTVPCPPGPAVPSAEPGTVPQTPATQASPETQPSVDLADLRSGAGRGESFALAAGAYLDNPVPLTEFRLRYTAAYDDNRPDRAEFFYAKCGCFRVAGLDPHAAGPPLLETKVDYQDITGYLEYAPTSRLSGFIEVPYRFLNPEQNANTNGFADMNAGFKFAFVAEPDQYLTFQFRTYIPTGDAGRGLGTDHVSLEPGLLFCKQLGERLSVQGQVEDWIPVGGTDFAGNVINYGVGASYDVYNKNCLRIAPVAEFVGWTVLGGKELTQFNTIEDASGNTIVNGKFGVRFWYGNSTFYAGYGHALTGTVWYKDIVRVEYAVHF
jgi:hypothetical protein